MIGTLLRMLSPGGRRGAHQVLFFHRVPAESDPLMPGELDRAAFDALLGVLRRHCHILPLGEAVQRLAADRLPRASLSITFDDGYADNAEVALPLLQAHGLPASFFVSSGYLDGGRMWNDTVIETLRRLPSGRLDLGDLGLGQHQLAEEVAGRRAVLHVLLNAIKHRDPAERQALADAIGGRVAGLPGDLMMTSGQLRTLAAAGMEIGAHTVHHPILTCLPDAEARTEIADGREQLQDLLRQPVRLFAYPNGKHGRDYDDRHVAMVRELGFDAAFSTEPGVSRRTTDRWQLPRFTPWDHQHRRFLLRLLMNRHGLIR